MQTKAYAKLNLTLDILRRRDDGYHDLQMVMQSIDLADDLEITPAQGTGSMSTTLSYLPSDGRNLAQIAAQAFREATGSALQVDIAIRKRIPVCAGMAGGSSDAAAVLRAMDALAGTCLTPGRLAEIGQNVGSDVPYCVLGGTALAEGRGETLTPLPPLPPCHIVVCKPPFPSPPLSCSAGWMCAGSPAARILLGCSLPSGPGIWWRWPVGCTTCLRMCWNPAVKTKSVPSRLLSSTAAPWVPP